MDERVQTAFICNNLTVAVTQFFVVDVNVASAKQNHSTKDVTKKAMEEELKIWFSNARDRGSGGRKMNHKRQPLRTIQHNSDSDN